MNRYHLITIQLCFDDLLGVVSIMQTSGVNDKIRQLSNEQAEEVYQYLFSAERELDRLPAMFDRLPRKASLTKDETLALPRG